MKGFTLIELLITVAIVAVLASVALPMAETTVQRGNEQDLRRALREIRTAIDAYKAAFDEGAIERKAGVSGYPPSLAALASGVPDARTPEEKMHYFLRRVPADPVSGEPWGLRSYASPAGDPREGADVFDVYSRGEGLGMNGLPYKDW